jgi:hypothetical protein
MSLEPLPKDSAKLTCDQVHDLTKEIIRDAFPEVEINGYTYTENEIWDVLIYASANRISIHAACEQLENAPSSNWVYTFLKQEVLQSFDLQSLESKGNEGLESALPKRLRKKSQKVAVDLVLIPYYGDEATPMVYRSQAKSSTTKFFCYASAYVIKKNKRVTLAFTFVRPEDSLLEVLARLEQRIAEMNIRIKRLYLDRQFARVDILKYLEQKPYTSVVPIPKKGKVIKSLQEGRQSYRMFYTMSSPQYGEITFPLWMACRYRKGRAKKRGVQYLFFAVIGECRSTELQIAEEYRLRFGIETSYRVMNRARATTTSRNAGLRLLLVALGFLLVNVWVCFKWNLVLLCRRHHVDPIHFTLNLFCHFVAKRIEDIYGAVTEIEIVNY